VPRGNCRHTLWNKDEQSLFPVTGEAPNETTIYKIASYCSECRWHIDVGVDFCNDGSADEACKKGTEHPLHHFVFDPDGDPNGVDGVGSQQAARTYMFICAAPKCPVRVHIHMKPPHISDQDVETLTNQAQLRLRFERAKQLAGDRADTSMARKVDGLDFLNTYLQDALNPAKSKARIPLLNKKFLKTFGRDCDSILMRFGFTTEYEEEDGDMLQIWHLPKPEEESNPLEFTLKNKIEDARYELNTLIMNMPEGDRANARHKPLYPGPSQDHIERALGCNDCMLTMCTTKQS
jgi:ubiquitin carboxyl-terminal hydrolase 25/28